MKRYSCSIISSLRAESDPELFTAIMPGNSSYVDLKSPSYIIHRDFEQQDELDDINTFQFPNITPSQHISVDLSLKVEDERMRRGDATETIDEWWKGEITEVNYKEGFFVSQLQDLKGNRCIAEFDIDKVFNNIVDAQLYLFEKSEFAFYVVTKHGWASPVTMQGIEFSSPYIWKEKDNDEVGKLVQQYFDE